MPRYTDDELLAAVRQQMLQDAGLRKQIEDSVSSKWAVRLRRLIADIAELFFGRVVGSIVDRVLSWFLH